MNLFRFLRPVAVLLVAAGILSLPARASAEVRPYKSNSTALLDLATGDFVAAGKATHLGKYTESGSVLISGDDLAALHVEGSATLIAANGDELDLVITGQLNFNTGEITATVTFDGGEGRFEDASGSALLLGQMGPDGISVVVVGTIDY